MKMLDMIRKAVHRFKEGIKPSSARHVEELTQEIRLDTKRILAEAEVDPPSPPPVARPVKKKKEDSTGSFPAFHT